MNATDTSPEAITHQTTSEDHSDSSGRMPLRRPVTDRMLAGVASGIADYLGADVTVVRIIMVALVFLGGAGIPLYLAGWLLIPEEGSDQSLAGELLAALPARDH